MKNKNIDVETHLLSQGEIRITLNDYIRVYYGVQILPLPKNLYDFIKTVMDYVLVHNDEMPYFGRINEYGNHMEKVFIEALTKHFPDVKAEKLGGGYPDTRIKINNTWIYPEIKIAKDVYEVGSFRSFYTSRPKDVTKNIKNIQDGSHLLIHFEHNGPGRLTGRYRVSDMDGYEYTSYGCKQEGNTKDLYENHNKVILESN
jgi:hypothetical protein